MGHIKEPKGVDFIIKSEPLTDEERKAISEFIRKDRALSKSEFKKENCFKKKRFGRKTIAITI